MQTDVPRPAPPTPGVGGNYLQFGDGVGLGGNVNGGSGGSNTLDLSASTGNLRVTFVGTHAGTVLGAVRSFVSISSVIGGGGSNTFFFNNGTSLDGTLDGGSSGSNTLSSAYSRAESFTITPVEFVPVTRRGSGESGPRFYVPIGAQATPCAARWRIGEMAESSLNR
jgi:hypothetical protein